MLVAAVVAVLILMPELVDLVAVVPDQQVVMVLLELLTQVEVVEEPVVVHPMLVEQVLMEVLVAVELHTVLHLQLVDLEILLQ